MKTKEYIIFILLYILVIQWAYFKLELIWINLNLALEKAENTYLQETLDLYK